MLGEHSLGLCRCRRLPVLVHASAVPLARQVVHALRRGHVAPWHSAVVKVGLQLGFRPKAADVESGVDHVVPEMLGRDDQVHHTVRLDDAVGNSPNQTVDMGLAVSEDGQ